MGALPRWCVVCSFFLSSVKHGFCPISLRRVLQLQLYVSSVLFLIFQWGFPASAVVPAVEYYLFVSGVTLDVLIIGGCCNPRPPLVAS